MAVGKSCLLHQFTENRCSYRPGAFHFRTRLFRLLSHSYAIPLLCIELVISDSTHTIGVEFGTRVVDLQGKKIKLQVRCMILFSREVSTKDLKL